MLANVKILYLFAVLYLPLNASAQQTDYFPTFDMMSMLEISEERPIRTSSGKILRLSEYYGHEVECLFNQLGEPDSTSGILYYSDYPGCRLDFDTQVDIDMLLDLYRDKEVAIKIYRWTTPSISVFSVQDNQLFASYPCGLTRFYSYDLSGICCPMLPLEKWIACDSGDKGWRILMWRNENNANQSLHAEKGGLEYFRYAPIEKTSMTEHLSSPSGFMSRFSNDSFTSLYFNSLELKHFMLDESVSCHLTKMSGKTEEDFISYLGLPDSVMETIDGDVPFLTLHEIWPFHVMLSKYEDNYSFPVKVYVYKKGDYELYAYFMRDDDFFLFPKIDGYISLADYCEVYPVFHSGCWRLAYADIAPSDAEFPPFVEF